MFLLFQKVINVPIADDDIIKTVTSLPRTEENNGIVDITMKRKLIYKKPYKEESIDINQLSLGLQYLRSNHPSYFNVRPLIMSLQEALNEEVPQKFRKQEQCSLKVAQWITEDIVNYSEEAVDENIRLMSLDQALTEEIERLKQLELATDVSQSQANAFENYDGSSDDAMSVDNSDELSVNDMSVDEDTNDSNIHTMALDDFLTEEISKYKSTDLIESYLFHQFTLENVQHESSSDEDEGDDVKNPFLATTCLIPENPETRVIVNTSSQIVKRKLKATSNVVCEVAPGEGKVVSNYMREEDFDTAGFPRHFPDGKYGLNWKKRMKKITPQQFFSQRLLNVDKRFAKDSDFLFVAQQYVERYGLERQIDVSMQKGSLLKTNDGTKVIQTKDAFSVFKNIPGTPAYWKTFRNEIFAKIEQLGPFHLFFTLSCAEHKWPEIITALLQAEGNSITFSTSPWDGQEDSIHVNGIPLKEFCAGLKNKSLLFQENVILITQMFDNRVKAFIKNVFASNKSYPIKHYAYRIEFQVKHCILFA